MIYNLSETIGFGFYYFIFLIIIFFLVVKKAKYLSESQFYLCVGILLIFITTFRAVGIDKDYTTYQNSFSLVRSPIDYFTNYSDWSYFEPFYYLIPSFLKTFNIPFYETTLFLLFATIGISLNLSGIKKLSSSGIAVLVYFSFFFFLHEMTQIRVGIACGCLLLGTYYYFHKNYKSFFLILFTAMCFQYTGILMLTLLLLNPKKFNLFTNLLILLISFLCVLFRVNVISEFLFIVKLPFTDKLMLTLQTLTKKENELNAFNIPYLANLLITIWLFINHKKISVINRYSNLLLKIQLLSFVCFGIFSSVAVIAFRLYEFFGIISVITTCFLLYTTRQKVIAYLGIMVYSLLVMINMLHITKLIAPYDLIFL